METYEPLEMEIIEFDGEDIITTSSPRNDGDWPGGGIGQGSGRQNDEGGTFTC